MKKKNLLVLVLTLSLIQSNFMFAMADEQGKILDAPGTSVQGQQTPDKLPDNLTQAQLDQLAVRVKDLQNASESRKEQAENAKKALEAQGDCDGSMTQAQCIQDKIELNKARMELMSDGAKAKAQQDISALELELNSPKSLSEASDNFSLASSTLEEMLGNMKNGDFSWKEHFGVIGKAILLSFKDLLSPAPIIAISAGMAGYGVARATSLNQDSHDYFSQNPTPTIANQIGNQLGYAYPVLAPFLIVGLITKNNDTMLTFDELAVGTAVSEAIVEPLKYIVRESRPNHSDNLGFPSAHAAQSFMMATILDHRYGHKVGILAYFAAAGVTLIRAGQDLHSPGELMAGAGIGIASAIAAEHATESEWDQAEGIKRAYWKDAVMGNFRIPKTNKVIHCVPMVGLGGSCNLTW